MEQSTLVGAILDGKYRVARMIGQGGMGAVYHADHLGTGRPVAVKVLLSTMVGNAEAVERFRREARAAGGLRHPNIVDVTDFGVARAGGVDIAYLVMEYLQGSTLRALIDLHGALPSAVVVDIVEQIALALEVAHRSGTIHRDLKPDNVWLVPDARGGYSVRVLDFGIARLRNPATATSEPAIEIPASDTSTIPIGDEDATAARMIDPEITAPRPTMQVNDEDEDTARLTTAGTTVGTPYYMSPEQCVGRDVDRRSDVYSLGVLTYEALSGRRPFRGTFRELIERHQHEAPPPLGEVSPRVAAVVMRALAKAPDDRYPTAQAMAGSLRVATEGPSVIVRRCIALYAERFHDFFRVSRRATLPVLPLLLPLIIAAPFVELLGIPVVFGVAMLLWIAVTMMTNTAFAAAIERLRVRPLDALDASDVFSDVRQRLGLPPSASWWRTFRRLGVFYLRCELRVGAGTGDLGFLIAFIEGKPIEELRERCAILAKQSSSAYKHVGAMIFLTLLIVPFLEGVVILTLLRGFTERAELITVVLAAALVPVNAMLVNPVFSSALALLYFRARQANGEDVALAAVLPSRM